MRKAIGIVCIILGVVCMLSSVGFVLYNKWEDKKVQESSKIFLQSAQLAIQEKKEQEASQNVLQPEPPVIQEQELPSQPPIVEEPEPSVPEVEIEEPEPEMPTVSVDGYDCIGILSIPVLELELPVFTGWSYEKLKIAPCHYYGSYISGDFVIAGHNYKAHFKRLSELQPQDLIIFTDAEGNVHQYEVFLLETLTANATKEMIDSGFDLSLYTCTPGGINRVTVRCLSKDFTESK